MWELCDDMGLSIKPTLAEEMTHVLHPNAMNKISYIYNLPVEELVKIRKAKK